MHWLAITVWILSAAPEANDAASQRVNAEFNALHQQVQARKKARLPDASAEDRQRLARLLELDTIARASLAQLNTEHAPQALKRVEAALQQLREAL